MGNFRLPLTLLTYGTAAMTYNKLIYADIKCDAERDFSPVTQLTEAPLALYVSTGVRSEEHTSELQSH